MADAKPPAWPPFTHFPWSRGDMLAGEPVPALPAPETLAAMTLEALVRRVKALDLMTRIRQLGHRFHAEAHTERDVLVAEMGRRIALDLAERDAQPKRGAHRSVPGAC